MLKTRKATLRREVIKLVSSGQVRIQEAIASAAKALHENEISEVQYNVIIQAMLEVVKKGEGVGNHGRGPRSPA